MTVKVVTGPEWKRFVGGCKAAGDGGLMKEVRGDIRKAGKTAGEAVKARSPAYMPDRYATEMAGSLRITASATGSGVLLRGRAKTPRGKPRELRRLEAGVLRHPNYGRWVKGKYMQAVKPGFWSDPLGEQKPAVERAVKGAMDRVADRIA